MSMLGYDYTSDPSFPVEIVGKFKPFKMVKEDTLYVYFQDKSYLEVFPPELINTFTRILNAHNSKNICGYSFHLPSCNMAGRKRFSKKDIEKMINVLLGKVKSKNTKNTLIGAKRVLKNRGFI